MDEQQPAFDFPDPEGFVVSVAKDIYVVTNELFRPVTDELERQSLLAQAQTWAAKVVSVHKDAFVAEVSVVDTPSPVLKYCIQQADGSIQFPWIKIIFRRRTYTTPPV